MELIQELNKKIKELSKSVSMLREHGTSLAQKEADYRMVKYSYILKLKEQGEKATLIPLMVNGIKDVADARLIRDIAKVTYDANIDHINATKLQIRIIESQIKMDYGKTE